jgi:hypothetical protein
MNFNHLLSETAKIQQLNVEDAVAVASYPASGSFIDVSQYERFAFLVAAGALDSELTFQVQQADAVNGTPKDVTGAVVVVPADGDDKWYLVEVQTSRLDSNNGYRYVSLKATGAAGGNDYAAIFFFGLTPGLSPVTQGADKGEIVVVAG